MDQQAVLGFDDDGDEDVDMTTQAMSAAAYLRQMRAERKQTADVSTVKNQKIKMMSEPEAKRQREWLESVGFQETPREKASSSLIPSEDWQKQKCQQFSEFRAKVAEKLETQTPMKIKALKSPEEEEWHAILLDRCLPEFESFLPKFPNHTGTPPTIDAVFAIPKRHLSQLIEHLVEWSSEEGLSRPIREWIFALLLVIDLPLVQDVVSALRTLLKECKNLRSQLSEDRKSEAYEYSFFIAIIGIYFGQKDLADIR